MTRYDTPAFLPVLPIYFICEVVLSSQRAPPLARLRSTQFSNSPS
jgi:hypothetical protein